MMWLKFGLLHHWPSELFRTKQKKVQLDYLVGRYFWFSNESNSIIRITTAIHEHFPNLQISNLDSVDLMNKRYIPLLKFEIAHEKSTRIWIGLHFMQKVYSDFSADTVCMLILFQTEFSCKPAELLSRHWTYDIKNEKNEIRWICCAATRYIIIYYHQFDWQQQKNIWNHFFVKMFFFFPANNWHRRISEVNPTFHENDTSRQNNGNGEFEIWYTGKTPHFTTQEKKFR